MSYHTLEFSTKKVTNVTGLLSLTINPTWLINTIVQQLPIQPERRSESLQSIYTVIHFPFPVGMVNKS